MKTLPLLFGATAVAVVAAAAAVYFKGSAQAAPESMGLLYGDLGDKMAEVREVRLEKQDETLTLTKSGSDWSLVESGGFPARANKVSEVVVRLARMQIEEPKTKNPASYAKLGVEEPDAPDADSARLVLKDAAGEELANVILGETKYRGRDQTMFVRRAGEEQSYLCSGAITVDTAKRNWIETEILKLAGDRVDRVRIEHADGEVLEIARSAESTSQFDVLNQPEGRDLKSPSIANGLGTALTNVQLDDVRPASEVDFAAEPLARTTFECEDGLHVTLESARAEEATWVKVSASYVEPPEAVGPTPAPEEPSETDGEAGEAGSSGSAETGDAGEGAQDDSPDPEEIRKEVEVLNAKHAAWAYKLPSYKADSITQRMESFLAEPALPEDEDAEPDAIDVLDLDALNPNAPEPVEEVDPLDQDG